ncbi:hypothetical protein GS624_03620 [Ruegeria sp. HKCCD5849]|uniref:hypothetical protein n=1 Tax=unclassified Ruegeria TaxID=2625375 RepID=UPI001491F2E1|nr:MULTISPECIES: hypothetical protein [unclassified Ruegeria]NOD46393.1 hypothetical protein [Ruegeria sp. HKCCD5849]NOD50307.1 hypothetical protein [Ruegeria sp. HKCCD5851]
MNTYKLDPWPTFAPLAEHANTLSQHLYGVGPKTISRWPVDQPVVTHKRQPMTVDVWAIAVARLPEAARGQALMHLPKPFAEAIRDKLPAAIEANEAA